MRGIIAVKSSGLLWPGGANRTFGVRDVRSLGKLFRYNDSVTRYIVRLLDDALIFIKAAEQSEEDQRWLARLSRCEQRARTSMCYPSRDLPEVIHWYDVPKEWSVMHVLNEDDRDKLAARIRSMLRRAKQPLTLQQIAEKLGVATNEAYEAISINLHGFYEMREGAFRWLR